MEIIRENPKGPNLDYFLYEEELYPWQIFNWYSLPRAEGGQMSLLLGSNLYFKATIQWERAWGRDFTFSDVTETDFTRFHILTSSYKKMLNMAKFHSGEDIVFHENGSITGYFTFANRGGTTSLEAVTKLEALG